jgi:niacin transporter
MNRNENVMRLAVAALLVAVGILIPMFMPLKLYILPMSFTLASHVAIFIAMFISPVVAFAVTIGTTVGFVFSGLPMDVWLRALSQVVWAVLGSMWLKANPDILYKPVPSTLFCLVVAVVHGALEVMVIFCLYFGGFGGVAEKFQESGYLVIFLLVGAGTLIHSCIDYALSLLVWRPIRKLSSVRAVASVH